jgi:hypothetical protein
VPDSPPVLKPSFAASSIPALVSICSISAVYVANRQLSGAVAPSATTQFGFSALVSVETFSTSADTAALSTRPAASSKRANDASTAAFGRIRGAPRPLARNGAYFCERVNLTVSGSTTSMEVTLSAMLEQTSGLTRQFGDFSRSYVNFTSSEVIVVPSWNLIPSLILTVQVRPSSETSGWPSAAHGWYTSL